MSQTKVISSLTKRVAQVVSTSFSIFFCCEIYACGTVTDWVDYYFDHSDNEKKIWALSEIHCEPVVSDKYKATLREHKLLAKMIGAALDEVGCSQDLAIKNYFVFDQLFQLRRSGDPKDSIIIDSLIKRMHNLRIPVEDAKGSASLSSSSPSYCAKVAEEIKMLRDTAKFACGGAKCKKIK